MASNAQLQTGLETVQSQLVSLASKVEEITNGQRARRQMLNARAALPTKFGGKKSEFKEWMRGVKAYCNNQFPGFRKILDRHEQMTEEIGETALLSIDWPHVVEANPQLYDLLMTSTYGEPQLKIDAVTEENGLEAFRRLTQHYDPYNAQNELSKFNSLTTPTRCRDIGTVSA